MSAILFLGEQGGNRLLRADDGYQDAGSAVPVRLETVPVAPAGPGGEAIFTALYVVLTATMAASVQVTPIVDGVELATQTITLSAQASRKTTHHELGLSVALLEGATEVARFAARGTWFQARISVSALAAGDLIVDGLALEHEVVRESIPAQAIP